MADSTTPNANANKNKTGEDVSLRYRGLSYEMALELNYCAEKYFTWDLPVPFGELRASCWIRRSLKKIHPPKR